MTLHSSTFLATRPLVLAAIAKKEVLADRRFPPGSTLSVGSNSGNDLIIPERYELTSYTLITHGSVLCLAPPLHVATTVWWQEQPLALRGPFRDLRKTHPDLPDALPLASERFVVTYATGIALMGRFLLGDER